MDRVKMWRGIALGMTALAMTSIAVTLAGASPFASTPAQETAPRQDQVVDGRQYEWRGVVYWDELEGGHWAIKTECGLWALTTDNVETLERIKKNQGSWVTVWGTVFDGASIVMRQTIKVDSIFGKGDPMPMTLVAIPDYCATHGLKPTPTPEPFPPYPVEPVYPTYYPGNSFSYVLGNILQSLIGNQYYMKPETQFDTFVEVRVTVLRDGKESVVSAVGGVTVSNDGSTLVIEQNGPAGQAKYALDGVRILRMGGGSAKDIKTGDKVVVVTRDGKPAVVIASVQVTMWPEYYGEPRPLPVPMRDSGPYGGGVSSSGYALPERP